jgi:hypothetical protein
MWNPGLIQTLVFNAHTIRIGTGLDHYLILLNLVYSGN